MTSENGDRVAELQEQILLLAWLHAELNHKNYILATSVAALLAQQLTPQVQQSILSKLTGGS